MALRIIDDWPNGESDRAKSRLLFGFLLWVSGWMLTPSNEITNNARRIRSDGAPKYGLTQFWSHHAEIL